MVRLADAREAGDIITLDPHDPGGQLIALMKAEGLEEKLAGFCDFAETIVSLSEPEKVVEGLFSADSGIPPMNLLFLADVLVIKNPDLKDKIVEKLGAVVTGTKTRAYIVDHLDDALVGEFYKRLLDASRPAPGPLPRPHIQRHRDERIKDAETRGTAIVDMPADIDEKKAKLIEILKDKPFEGDKDAYFNVATTLGGESEDVIGSLLGEIFLEDAIPIERRFLLAEAMIAKFPKYKPIIVGRLKGAAYLRVDQSSGIKADYEDFLKRHDTYKKSDILSEPSKVKLRRLVTVAGERSAVSPVTVDGIIAQLDTADPKYDEIAQTLKDHQELRMLVLRGIQDVFKKQQLTEAIRRLT